MSGNKNELWVFILQKVWAKVHGDYLSNSGGFPEETFRDLTGAPAINVDIKQKSKETIW